MPRMSSLSRRPRQYRKLFSTIWGVHFVRAHLRLLELGEDDPEVEEALDWFGERKSSVTFNSTHALVTVNWDEWTGPKAVRMAIDPLKELSMSRLLARLIDRPEIVQGLLEPRKSPELDRKLREAGIDLYPVTRLQLSAPRSRKPLTKAESLYVVLCVGERLVEDGVNVNDINNVYSWRKLKERGYTPTRPLDTVVPFLDFALERSLRPLPAWKVPETTREEALKTLLEALPAEVPTGGFTPAWIHMFPSECTSSPRLGAEPAYYLWMPSTKERETLGRLAAKAEKFAAKARSFLLRDAGQGRAVAHAAETPWTGFARRRSPMQKGGIFPMAVALAGRFWPFVIIKCMDLTFEENLNYWLEKGFTSEFDEDRERRWNLLEDYVSILLYMPKEAASKQPERTIVWRALCRFAWAFMAKGAIVPVPYVAEDEDAVSWQWLPRLDLPAGGALFGDLCRLLSPLLDLVFVRDLPFGQSDPECVRKTVLFALGAVLQSFMTLVTGRNLVNRYDPSGINKLIAYNIPVRRYYLDIDRIQNFFALPLGLLELPGRPALLTKRAEDGMLTFLRGILPFGAPADEANFVDDSKLTPTNRIRLSLVLDTVFLSKVEDLEDDFFYLSKEKYPRRRPSGTTIGEVRRPVSYLVPCGKLDDFIVSGIAEIRSLGVEVILPDEIVEVVHPELTLSIDEGAAISGGFLNACALADFDWHAVLGGMAVTKELILKLIEEAGRIVEFGGRSLYLSKEEALALRGRIEDPELAPERLDAWEKLRAVLTGNFKGLRVEATDGAKARIQKLLRVEELPVPPEITATLRPYQERGFSWIMKNLRLGLGALIADDMGLGKTLQVIAALQQMKNDGELSDASVLVVAPASIMVNWQREFEKFAPQMSVSLYHGAKRAMAEEKAHTDVVITSYGTFRRDAEALGTRKWRLMVLDEAQAIKNFLTHQSKAARLFPVPQVIGMTGTPVENRLLDYWSILAAVQPGLLGGKTSFQRDFITPIETGGPGSLTVLKRFQALTAPFILRRLKTDKSIIADLPEKRVIDRFTTLTPRQLVLYRQSLKTGLTDLNVLTQEAKATKNAALAEVVNRLKMKRRGRILMMLTQLKQITNSPALFEKKTSKKPDSGKGEALIDLLEEARDAGSKTLLFTQYREMGELLCGWIANAGLGEPLFLHGGVPVSARTGMVDRFQNDPEATIMIITLKAGGTGLNLTAASVVIHYDLWWNPAVENQATDRAHRIGQDKDVLVYRFVTAGTFEERINRMLEAKRKLADLTVQSREKWIGEMSDEEIAEIFRPA